MKKIIYIIASLLIFASCNDDNPVAVNNYFDTLPNILDGNWREVTDIDSTIITCIYETLIPGGFAIQDSTRYNELLTLTRQKSPVWLDTCLKYSMMKYFNYDERSLLYYSTSIDGKAIFDRKIVINDKEKQARVIIIVKRMANTLNMKWETNYYFTLSVPKIPNDYRIYFFTQCSYSEVSYPLGGGKK